MKSYNFFVFYLPVLERKEDDSGGHLEFKEPKPESIFLTQPEKHPVSLRGHSITPSDRYKCKDMQP